MDTAGNLYIADLGNHRVRKVSGGVIATVAGTGQAGSGGDGGKASAAQLYSPRNVVVDGFGSVYIAEFDGHRVPQVTPDGLIVLSGDALLKDPRLTIDPGQDSRHAP